MNLKFNEMENERQLTAAECNILDTIASKTRMDCWFWIEERDSKYVIYDLENGEILSLKDGVSQLMEGAIDTADHYGLTETEINMLQRLIKDLGIECDSPILKGEAYEP